MHRVGCALRPPALWCLMTGGVIDLMEAATKLYKDDCLDLFGSIPDESITDPGDVVLDNAMGGSSCGIACANTGRRFIEMGKAPVFFGIAEVMHSC